MRFFLRKFILSIKFKYYVPFFAIFSILVSVAIYSYLNIFSLYNKLTAEQARVEQLRKIVREDKEKTRILGIINSFNTGLSAKEKRSISVLIYNISKKYNVNPALILSVIRAESSFNNFSVSDKGAVGLMQVQPVTGLYLIKKYDIASRKFNYNARYMDYLPPSYLYNPSLNIKLGVVYFIDLIHKFKNLELALFAYNAGPTLTSEILDSVQRNGSNDSRYNVDSTVDDLEKTNIIFNNFYYFYYSRIERYLAIYNKKIFGTS